MDDAVRRLLAPHGRLLLVVDFDGTLSAFVPDPMGAEIVPAARRSLRRLARIAAARPERLSVALLTGRTALDVATRVRVGGIRYVGNMGNESGLLPRRIPAEKLVVVPAPGLTGDTRPVERLVEAVVAALPGPGLSGPGLPAPAWLFVERKGPAVAFHYRAAPDRTKARTELEEAFRAAADAGRLAPFDRIDGRLLVDFQPTGAGAKGAAVTRLVEELDPAAVAVIGDDRADADAFTAIHRACAAGRLTDALAIGVRHPHPLPAEVEAEADLLVDGIHGAVAVLGGLARALERDGQRVATVEPRAAADRPR